MKCNDFLMLIRHVTLWPWPLTRWPLRFVADLVSRGHGLYQIWLKLNNARLSYSWFRKLFPRYISLWPWPFVVHWCRHYEVKAVHIMEIMTALGSSLEIFVYINRILTKSCRKMLGGSLNYGTTCTCAYTYKYQENHTYNIHDECSTHVSMMILNNACIVPFVILC